jgi:hypothetical protein
MEPNSVPHYRKQKTHSKWHPFIHPVINISFSRTYPSASLNLSIPTYIFSGTSALIPLHQSHLAPLPFSHVAALTKVILFSSPGSKYSKTVNPKELAFVSVPPVSLRLIIAGLLRVYAGQVDAALGADGFGAEAPLAMLLEMEGLFRVTKLPHIALDVLEHGEIRRERRGKYFEKLSRNRDLDLGLAARNTLGGLWSGVRRRRSIGIYILLGGRGSRLLRASRRDRRLWFRRIFPIYHLCQKGA